MRSKTKLYPHQQEAVDKLMGVRVGALYMEQGTGKTRTALELIARRMAAGKVNHIIWLCPCNALEDISDNIHFHADLDSGSLTMCGIETLSSSVRANEYLRSLVAEKQCFLVVDESLLVKNPYALRTQNITRLAEQCRYKLILNGTPISRTAADLFSQWYLLDWRILGYRSYWSFAANHLEYDECTNRIRRVLHLDYLTDKIAPYTYQITKAECLDLPPKRFATHLFDLTHEQYEHYAEVADQLMLGLDVLPPEAVYRLFSGTQSVAAGRFVHADGPHIHTEPYFASPWDNPRVPVLLDLLDSDDKAIIYCKYTSEIEDVCRVLCDTYGAGAAVRFDGDISRKMRRHNIKQFRGSSPFLVANRNCAGYGLNLQYCHHIIYYNNDWDLATRLQSEDRVHRLGQEHEVIIDDIIANGTIEVRIADCLARKTNMLDSFNGELSSRNKIIDAIFSREGAA